MNIITKTLHTTITRLHELFIVSIPFFAEHQLGIAIIALGVLILIYGIEVVLAGLTAKAAETVAVEVATEG